MLFYGSETWTLQKRHRRIKLQAIDMRSLREVEVVTRMDKVRRDDIREKTEARCARKYAWQEEGLYDEGAWKKCQK